MTRTTRTGAAVKVFDEIEKYASYALLAIGFVAAAMTAGYYLIHCLRDRAES